ncbi:hypothetical protein GJ496_000024 [Pomphorhynchus laevis]|nr:hypothetical protein GJ496_000024 [Pomphorhynchus laevis]
MNIDKNIKFVDKPGRCQFFCERKRRPCSMYPVFGAAYCVHHLSTDSDLTQHNRVQCPLDPNHKVREDKLEKHLHVCTARNEHSRPVTVARVPLLQMDDKTVHYQRWIKVLKLLENYSVLPEKLQTVFENSISLSDNEKSTKQCQALADIIYSRFYNRNITRYCFVEVGAGRKAGLSRSISELFPNSEFILIDRQSFKCKQDNLLKLANCKSVQRIRKDLSNFDFKDLVTHIEFNDEAPFVIAVGKHLCGTASDLLIQKVLQEPGSKDTVFVGGLVLAFCCYQKCVSLEQFTGKSFFQKHNLDQGDFQLLCYLSSWRATFINVHSDIEDETTMDHISKEFKRMKIGQLTDYQRKLIGNAAKMFLDHARLSAFQLNSSAELLNYVNESITPQNVAIVANVCKMPLK